jgi:hypothetical protein
MDSAAQELEMAKYHTKMIVNGSLWQLFQLTTAGENRLSHQRVKLLPSLDFVDIICYNENVTRKTQVPSLAPFVHRPSLLHSQLQMNSRGLAVWLKWIDRREVTEPKHSKEVTIDHCKLVRCIVPLHSFANWHHDRRPLLVTNWQEVPTICLETSPRKWLQFHLLSKQLNPWKTQPPLCAHCSIIS